MQKGLLIIFVKNLVPGNVKTRLAEDIGIDGALDVYQYLVEYTCEVTEQVEVDKAIYYSEYVEIEDIWDSDQCQYFVQKGNELGERMSNAFKNAFDKGYEKVVLIGSDCFEITTDHIEKAFRQLNDQDVVIGPAKDGGYYLLGLKSNHPGLFKNKQYGHDKVLKELLDSINQAGLTVSSLDKLADIDTFDDLKDSKIEFQFVDPDEDLDDA